ncbi:hypothetical protein NDU88_006271 [Pleurodeles waltl]|uniref:Uncharacterized protein n=1 Tax=Pleurodeles waltl TaxID=8319 RepID=A0AAV7NRF8_PLEWA|nr:hypothetical protein NDU88_006271 [Pleurodeles waltl]
MPSSVSTAAPLLARQLRLINNTDARADASKCMKMGSGPREGLHKLARWYTLRIPTALSRQRRSEQGLLYIDALLSEAKEETNVLTGNRHRIRDFDEEALLEFHSATPLEE